MFTIEYHIKEKNLRCTSLAYSGDYLNDLVIEFACIDHRGKRLSEERAKERS